MTNPVSTDERLRRTAGIRSVRLGGTTVTYLPDGVGKLTRGWLPDVSDEEWEPYAAYFDEAGELVASVGALLVEREGRALLIDAGYGPLSAPAIPDTPIGPLQGGALLDSLASVGRTPRDVEAVAVTHLHTDHIGWAWHPAPGSDAPAFAHATYLLSETEWSQRRHTEEYGVTAEMLAALEPRVRTVADGEEIFPGVRALATPGHTRGHTAYVISDGGQRLIAFGDLLHTPVQVDHPEWSAFPDHDPALSADVRRRLVDELARPDTLGFGVHFADVVFGRVDRDAEGPAWRPLAD